MCSNLSGREKEQIPALYRSFSLWCFENSSSADDVKNLFLIQMIMIRVVGFSRRELVKTYIAMLGSTIRDGTSLFILIMPTVTILFRFQ